MGGRGSGQWYRWNKKTTVEETRWIDAALWMRKGILKPNTHSWGGWEWRNGYTNEQSASIGYEVDTTAPPRQWIRLFYTSTPYGGEPQSYDYKVLLATTYPHFGGVRYWFICPLSRNDVPCWRRVGKLYLVGGGRYFGCRHCYDLTYTSSQESDKRVSRLANDPLALYAAMRGAIDDAGQDTLGSVPDLLLVSKAMRKRRLL